VILKPSCKANTVGVISVKIWAAHANKIAKEKKNTTISAKFHKLLTDYLLSNAHIYKGFLVL